MEQDPLIGKQIRDYLIQSRLGEGGMARVYKAYHIRLRREAAIKVILSNIAHDAAFQARFEQEARLVANLDHPNIVSIYDFGEENGQTFLAMQYVGGGTLRQSLQSGRPLEIRRAIHYVLQMARALHHAHQHGIVHRDVKPQNMLISASTPDQLLLSDFGIAKIFDSSQQDTQAGTVSTSHPLMTGVEQVVGTAAYMAPEQVERRPVDARTDVYALGVVLYQMLTGNAPFQSPTTQGLMYQHVHIPPRPVRLINPDIPPPLAQITEKALAKKPDQRFSSAEAMAQALESVLTSLANTYLIPPDQQPTPGGRQIFEPSTDRTVPTPPAYPPSPPYTPPSASHPSTSPPYVPSHRVPASPRQFFPTTRQRLQVGGAILATILVLLLALVGWPSLHMPSPQSPSSARSFTDTFHTNDNNWSQGSSNGLTATVASGQYTLITDTQESTHFPYPKAVGTLPANFILTAEIIQEQGSTQVFYGLVFYLQPELTRCYAFVMNNIGNYQILRYDGASTTPNVLWSGTISNFQSSLHKKNQLQVKAQTGHFSFTIDNQPVPLQPGQTTLTDTTYMSGQPGLLIAGPNTSFIVTKVQLEIV